jgi:hypothetical protein
MGNVTLWMQVSADGCVEGPNGEFDWPVVQGELQQYWLRAWSTRVAADAVAEVRRPRERPDTWHVLFGGAESGRARAGRPDR